MAVLALVPPTSSVNELTAGARVKPGGGIVSAIVVLLAVAPEVAFTMTEYFPGTALPLTSKVSPCVVALTLVNTAVTLAGTPDTARLTGFARPTGFVTPILMGRFDPFWPTVSVIAVAETAKSKLGEGMINATVAALFVAPEVPVIVRGYVPGTALLLAVAVSVTELPALAVGKFNAAVTPAGTPDTARFTFPLKLFNAETFTVASAAAPPAIAVTLAVEDESSKLAIEPTSGA